MEIRKRVWVIEDIRVSKGASVQNPPAEAKHAAAKHAEQRKTDKSANSKQGVPSTHLDVTGC
jgi:hypothetical protein